MNYDKYRKERARRCLEKAHVKYGWSEKQWAQRERVAGQVEGIRLAVHMEMRAEGLVPKRG